LIATTKVIIANMKTTTVMGWTLVAGALAFCSACNKDTGPSAMQVCKKIVKAGVGENCKAKKPHGLGSAATDAVWFDLKSVPGKTGQVLKFRKAADLEATEKAFDAAAILAGPHRYSSKPALIFVQMNVGASKEDGAKAEELLNKL